MRIKYSEGQTLLTLFRLVLVSIALLGSWGMQKVADECFYFAHNAREIVRSFLTDLSEEEGAGQPEAKEAYVLYYSLYDEADQATRYYYSVYYLSGSEGAWGLVSPDGEQLLENCYQSIQLLPQGFLLEDESGFRFYDQELNLLSDLVWDDADVSAREDGLIDCDLVRVCKDGLYGAVDFNGQVVIQPQYEQFDLYTFETDWQINRVEKNGKYGYIDRNGNTIVQLNYDFALLSTVKAYHEDEDPSDPEAGYDRPVVYVLNGDTWGIMYKLLDGSTGQVTWGVEPPAEMVEAAQQVRGE